MTDKEEARRFIQELRQIFIDWNYVPFNTDEFKRLESEIDKKVASALA
jgi:hypothetical protein